MSPAAALALIDERLAVGCGTTPGFGHKLPAGDVDPLVDLLSRWTPR